MHARVEHQEATIGRTKSSKCNKNANLIERSQNYQVAIGSIRGFDSSIIWRKYMNSRRSTKISFLKYKNTFALQV